MSMYPYIDELMFIQNKINCGMNENNLGDLYGIIEGVFKDEKIEELFKQMEMYIKEDSLEHKIEKMLNIIAIVRDYAQNHRIQYVTKYSDLDMVYFYGNIYFLLLRKTKSYDNYIRILNNLKDIYNGSIKTFSRFHYSYILNMILLIKEKYVSVKDSDFIRDNYMYKINVVDNKKIIEKISFNLLDAIFKIM
ncbi:MAG: hypothetical protein K6G26_07775, partial [Lachnospiraceae bacterium]|nr:hypothetical protein [Lachnospiraceae bacterium]